RRGIEIVIILFAILAMIALIASYSEQPLLENRIAPIPQCQGKTQTLMIVGNAAQAILTPPVDTRPCMIVRKILPRRAVRAVVLPHRRPLPLGKIRSPAAPILRAVPCLNDAIALGGHPRSS